MTDTLTIHLLLSLALLISVCLNIIFCCKQRDTLCTDKHKFCHRHTEEEIVSHVEEEQCCDVDDQEQENPLNHHEGQENPIYGNISTDRRDSSEDCYEMMSLQRTRESKKPLQSDLNYASLDLKLAKKRNKHRHLHGHGRSRHQDQQLDHLTPPSNTFVEMDTDMDAHLPSREDGVMVSHSSIYLNSQQIALETEEMERDGIRKCEEGRRRDWEQAPEGQGKNTDGGGTNGDVHLEVEGSQGCTEHFADGFSLACD